jgi:hypothetical protein
MQEIKVIYKYKNNIVRYAIYMSDGNIDYSYPICS